MWFRLLIRELRPPGVCCLCSWLVKGFFSEEWAHFPLENWRAEHFRHNQSKLSFKNIWSSELKLLSALHYTGSKELSAALRSEELTSIARGLTFVLNCWEVISNVFLLLGAVDHPIKWFRMGQATPEWPTTGLRAEALGSPGSGTWTLNTWATDQSHLCNVDCGLC